MIRGLVLAAVVALGLAAAAAPARAEVTLTSPLALPIHRLDHAGDGLLAQRVIDREWGLSDDSTYREVNVPGWKSEGFALALSGAVPGAGQLYSGEASGWLYVLADAAGWIGRVVERRHAQDRYQELQRFVGDPTDSSSGFSFTRYTERTGSNASDLAALWAGDHTAYYRALADDPAYAAGFSGSKPNDQYGQYSDLMNAHDDALHSATLIETMLFLNHVVSAFDALRAARVHNLPLRREYHLELGERTRQGHTELRAAIVRRF